MPDDRTRDRRSLWPWPGAAGALLLALAAAVAATGGAEWSPGTLRIRVHDPWRLLGAGILLTGVSAWIGGRQFAAALERAWDARERHAWIVAATAAVAVACAGISWGTWSAGSADAYGYVSQAYLWLQGVPLQVEPLASTVPWLQAEWSLSPLGYRPGLEPGTIVPTYAPGLPLTMALAAAIGGPPAVYVVVPLLGGAAVWLTYLIGRRYAGGASGAAAAVLLAASPAFLYQVVQPMSDVPVTAWWLLAFGGAAANRPLAAGCGAALAVLTRPNLVPAAAVVLAAVVLHAYVRKAGPRATARTAAARAGAAFAAPVGIAVAFLAWVNATLYGSPFASGYGTASELFSAGNIAPNAVRYTRWLFETHTPLILVCLAAPLAGRLSRRSQPGPPDAAWGWIGLAFACIVVFCYLPYAVFDDWWYLRFLLPAIAVILVLCAAVWERIVDATPAAWRLAALTAGIGLLATFYVVTARHGDTFQLRRFESRYAAAGAFASEHLPAGAVLFAMQESGSLRLYGGRTTIRFDHIDPRGLDAAIAFLDQSGRRPYFALESWEEDQFKDRFAPHSPLGRLDWPPMAEVGRPVKVRFYDPRDRARFLAGEPVATSRDRRDMPAAR